MPDLASLSFSAPALLAALLATPLLWLLFRAAPPPPRRIRFPAFALLKSLSSTKETPARTPPLLVLIRILCATALILGLAGPQFNASAPLAAGGNVLLVVDDSFAAAPDWAARRAALARMLDAAAQGQAAIFLMTTADPARAGVVGPLTAAEARTRTLAFAPSPLRADRATATRVLEKAAPALGRTPLRVEWLADGVASAGDATFAAVLKKFGALTVLADPAAPRLVLRPEADRPDRYAAVRLGAAAPFRSRVVAYARDGRELGAAPIAFAAGAAQTKIALDLPLALRNRLAYAAVDGVRSAGATALADARSRRALVGVVSRREAASDSLLTGAHYIRKALEPTAEFASGSIDEIITAGAGVIILDDIGRLRPTDAAMLSKWVEGGGALIRFAGDAVAAAIDDGEDPLMPVRLRGGRAVGGALSWESPQALGSYAATGPFHDLTPPAEELVRRQVLAEPSGETSERAWAVLKDGTPLVTGLAKGRGAIVLFHVTATPDWSDLPLTDAFVDMLRKLVDLAAIGPARNAAGPQKLPPVRVLDGYGRLGAPAADADGLDLSAASLTPGPDLLPGLYGTADAPVALNALPPAAPWRALDLEGLTVKDYAGPAPTKLAGSFFLLALALLAADALWTGLLAGAFGGRRRAAAAAFFAAFMLISPVRRAEAQPLDRPIAPAAVAAALKTRLAYVRTGAPRVDNVSEKGLVALSAALTARTSFEPAPPAAIDLETDDLSVYPFLYWPIVAGADPPSDEALDSVENFMRFGGLVVFDTGDDERAVAGVETPERAALRAILTRLDTPALSVLDRKHVLERSFYLLADLPGRANTTPIWVEKISGANDDVTPLIVGGRDWAAAWAQDEERPEATFAITLSTHELALRAGVNMVMVALAGNYKLDQLHTTALVKRLQQ